MAQETKAFFFYKQGRGDTKGLLHPGRPCRVLLGLNPPFSLILFHPEGNRGRTRKGIKFWIERFNHKLSRGTQSRGTPFQWEGKFAGPRAR